MYKSVLSYPVPPPSPLAPDITTVIAGTLPTRAEYYLLTFVNGDGETQGGLISPIAIPSGSLAVISPPDYPYPFSIYGYNVYGSTSSSGLVLQNSVPVLPGDEWTEPLTGLISGTLPPPSTWSSSSLTFGTYSFPKSIPAYQRSSVRHSNVSAAGILETIYEHTDFFTEFTLPWAQIGPDINGWNDFVAYAEQGRIFSFILDSASGGDGQAVNYTLWDNNWDAAYRSAGFYTFKMKWRKAAPYAPSTGITPVSGGGGGGGGMFADDVTPTDSGDHQNFTLPSTPSPSASLVLVLKGTDYYNQVLLEGVDYTLTTATITLSSPLSGTFYLRAWYRY